MSYRKLYTALGVQWSGASDNQLTATCPYPDCAKPGHWYLAEARGVWHCKRCGRNGNQYTFMADRAQHYRTQLTRTVLNRVATWRDMPTDICRGWYVGWDPGRQVLTMPVWGPTRKSATDIRTCRIGPKNAWRSTPGCNLGLYGLQWLSTATPDTDVWVCEGEWDGMALRWLLTGLKVQAVVVAVPGAGVWKQAWTDVLRGRPVVLAYDHDSAGERGDQRAWEALSGQVESIRSVHWPTACTIGWDVHAWVHEGVVTRKIPRKCWKALRECLRPTPVMPVAGLGERGTAPAVTVQGPAQTSWEELYKRYRHWLHMEDELALAIIYGAVFATRLGAPPVWLFIQTPPGGSKSELLMSLSECAEVFSLSSLTTHTLVSGDRSGDPSLLPKLRRKTLVVKDFTVLLQMRSDDRAAIFSTLRDAYDGAFHREFGNGVVRDYKDLHFGLLAGVTPVLEIHHSTESALGERFLRFRAEDGMRHLDDHRRIQRAMINTTRMHAMQADLRAAAVQFTTGDRAVPRVGPRARAVIEALSAVVARFRGHTGRNTYRPWMQDSLPFYEVPTRLAQQLIQLAKGVGMFYGVDHVDQRVLRVIARVARDTIPDRYHVVAVLLSARSLSLGKLCARLPHMTQPTVSRVLNDLVVLDLAYPPTGRATQDKQWRLRRSARAVLTGELSHVANGTRR